MKRILNITILLSAFFSVVSCVFDNDMSYPRVKGDITAFAVEGQKEVTINPDSLTVDVLLEETAEIDSLKLEEFTISELAVADTVFREYLNLREPVHVMLSTYPGRDYLWTISASQPIERYIDCSGFVEASFDVENNIALVYVTQEQPLDAVVINKMKLGPDTSVIVSTTGHDGADKLNVTKDVKFPMELDCTMARQFTVEYKGETSVWTLVFVQKKIQNEIKSVNAWTYHAYVTGEYDGVGTAHFEYKTDSESEWTVLDDVEVEGLKVNGVMTSLEPSVGYLVRLVSDTIVGEEYAFSTEVAEEIPNMNFDNWYKEGNIWYPDVSSSNFYWDTANGGSDAVKVYPTNPEDSHVVSGRAAKLESKKVPLVGLAAGNIYTGKFVKAIMNLEDPGAELDWGVPFSSRPLALRGHLDYRPGTVNVNNYAGMSGKTDIANIQVFLTDWSAPFRISTADGKFVEYDTDPGIIARGTADFNATDGYIEFTIPITYKSTSRTPEYVVISASASKYGDYFTGSTSSVMYVDEFSFIYDPSELTEEQLKQVSTYR